jgi:phage FluMu protein Com
MPIEFRCTQCQRLLRTQDDAAGKQAKCPECGTILVVPTPEVGSVDIPPPPPPPGAGSASPFGSPEGTSSPFGTQLPPRDSTQNPYQSPIDYMPGPTFAGSAGAITPTRIDLSDIFSRTWTILTNQYGMSLAVFIVTWLLGVAASFGVQFITAILRVGQIDPRTIFFVYTLGLAAYWVFYLWLNIGAALCYLRIARGQPATIGEIFSGGPYFLRVLLATVVFFFILGAVALVCVLPAAVIAGGLAMNAQDSSVIAIGVIIGAAVAFIPNVVVALGLSQYYYLLLDQNVGILESLSLSWKITHGNRLAIFAIWTVASIVGIVVTLLTCGLGGILLVAPFWSLMMPVIYLALTGQPTADRLYQPGSTV